ncbi:hypothetical protein GCM10009573_30750 [Agromyces bracchium]
MRIRVTGGWEAAWSGFSCASSAAREQCRARAERVARSARRYRACSSTKVRSIRLGSDTTARAAAASVSSSSSAAK